MNLFAGVVRCWPINASCTPDWEAWAAIATASGVLIALFAPLVRRWRLSKKADALFALSYIRDLQVSEARVRLFARDFPLASDMKGVMEARSKLQDEEDYRDRLRMRVEDLRALSVPAVNIADVPPEVSINLAMQIAATNPALKDLVQAGEVAVIHVTPPRSDEDEMIKFWSYFSRDLSYALSTFDTAERAGRKAVTRVLPGP